MGKARGQMTPRHSMPRFVRASHVLMALNQYGVCMMHGHLTYAAEEAILMFVCDHLKVHKA